MGGDEHSDVVDSDYRRWLDLGPGGLPANRLGWVITSALRPLGRDPLALDDDPRHDTLGLPDRGPRPDIAPYPIPHRQTHDAATRTRIAALTAYVLGLARDEPRLRTATSGFERRGDALYVRDPHPAWARRADGEIAHVHHTEGSLHVVAAPDDVGEIIGRGWGERHPLAGRPLIGLPDSYVFLYAPRDDHEEAVVRTIVDRVILTALAER